MHPDIFDAFDELCRKLPAQGAVIEIGASPHHQSLLTLPSLSGWASRTGIGLDGPYEDPYKRFTILEGNAHDLRRFQDGAFDLVLCNSLLEHDAKFWLTLAEAHRIAAPGAWMVFGVPGYHQMGDIHELRFIRKLAKLPLLGKKFLALNTTLKASSLTLGLQ